MTYKAYIVLAFWALLLILSISTLINYKQLRELRSLLPPTPQYRSQLDRRKLLSADTGLQNLGYINSENALVNSLASQRLHVNDILTVQEIRSSNITAQRLLVSSFSSSVMSVDRAHANISVLSNDTRASTLSVLSSASISSVSVSDLLALAGVNSTRTHTSMGGLAAQQMQSTGTLSVTGSAVLGGVIVNATGLHISSMTVVDALTVSAEGELSIGSLSSMSLSSPVLTATSLSLAASSSLHTHTLSSSSLSTDSFHAATLSGLAFTATGGYLTASGLDVGSSVSTQTFRTGSSIISSTGVESPSLSTQALSSTSLWGTSGVFTVNILTVSGGLTTESWGGPGVTANSAGLSVSSLSAAVIEGDGFTIQNSRLTAASASVGGTISASTGLSTSSLELGVLTASGGVMEGDHLRAGSLSAGAALSVSALTAATSLTATNGIFQSVTSGTLEVPLSTSAARLVVPGSLTVLSDEVHMGSLSIAGALSVTSLNSGDFSANSSGISTLYSLSAPSLTTPSLTVDAAGAINTLSFRVDTLTTNTMQTASTLADVNGMYRGTNLPVGRLISGALSAGAGVFAATSVTCAYLTAASIATPVLTANGSVTVSVPFHVNSFQNAQFTAASGDALATNGVFLTTSSPSLILPGILTSTSTGLTAVGEIIADTIQTSGLNVSSGILSAATLTATSAVTVDSLLTITSSFQMTPTGTASLTVTSPQLIATGAHAVSGDLTVSNLSPSAITAAHLTSNTVDVNGARLTTSQPINAQSFVSGGFTLSGAAITANRVETGVVTASALQTASLTMSNTGLVSNRPLSASSFVAGVFTAATSGIRGVAISNSDTITVNNVRVATSPLLVNTLAGYPAPLLIGTGISVTGSLTSTGLSASTIWVNGRSHSDTTGSVTFTPRLPVADIGTPLLPLGEQSDILGTYRLTTDMIFATTSSSGRFSVLPVRLLQDVAGIAPTFTITWDAVVVLSFTPPAGVTHSLALDVEVIPVFPSLVYFTIDCFYVDCYAESAQLPYVIDSESDFQLSWTSNGVGTSTYKRLISYNDIRKQA